MIVYEWDAETVNVHEDIDDHNHADTLSEVLRYCSNEPADGSHYRIVLVRDKFDECRGLVDRSWAYLNDDGTLPEYFSDSCGEDTFKVPKRFHREAASLVGV